MGLIPDEIIRDIRDRADLAQVISRYVTLRKAGVSLKGLCPFHQERTPSFHVHPDKGFFYCFGCQKKGDVFSFLMEMEGKGFADIARDLAELYGVDIPDESPGPARLRGQPSLRSQLFAANRAAADLFRSALGKKGGAEARAYLAGRGLDETTCEAFGLGFAPDSWDALGKALAGRGITADIAESAGLVVSRPQRAGTYDRFRNRVMCPVTTPGGDVAGFSGRLIEGDGPKYLNTPETEVYKKSKLLYGLDLARAGIRGANRAVLVEGNFDVVRLHQAGITETVAALGTALTSDQAEVLRRITGRVVLLYDGDAAGKKAALAALTVLLGKDLEVAIARLPDGADPDSFVREHGPDALARLLDGAQPAIEHYAYNVWSQTGATARAAALGEAAGVLKNVRDPTRRDLIVGTLSEAMGLDPAVVRRAVARAGAGGVPGDGPPPQRPAAAPAAAPLPPRQELSIITLLDVHPELLPHAEAREVFSFLTDSRLRDMYSAAREGRLDLSATADNIRNEIKKILADGNVTDVANPQGRLDQFLDELLLARRKHEISDLHRQLEAAQRSGDVERKYMLMRKIKETRKQVD
ncbi:MAG TPA: DNA primase [Kofleriaceae bacterium]|nr:DNA primase [Kofleriaceae bacterium]